MITICTVVTDALKKHIEIMLDSVVLRTKFVTEVKIAKVDADANLDEKWVEKGINFHMFGHRVDMVYGHSLGLHECIEKATNEYLLFCDPDVFFYSSVDKLYLELMNKYGINYIGCSHHASVVQAYTFFPYVLCSMVKKSDLPDKDWMKGELKYRDGILHSEDLNMKPDDDYAFADGKYLIPGPLPNHYKKFPNRDAKYAPYFYDTSCNLWLWSQEKDWKYLSFQTRDCHTYSTMYNRGNLKLEKLPKQGLIYHVVGGSHGRDWDTFTDAYKKSKEIE